MGAVQLQVLLSHTILPQDNSISTPKHILQILGENILVTLKPSPRIVFSILNRKS